MRVKTLDIVSLEEHAARLAEKVDDAGVVYDAVVGIKRGGSIVCDAFCRHFPQSKYALRCDVAKQRPSTKRKSGVVGKMLKHLPYTLLDIMRIAEARALSLTHSSCKVGVSDNVKIPESLANLLKENARPSVLIIDDAVDSGATVRDIISGLQRINPEVEVKVAVLTVTTSTPCVNVDYTIYNSGTLIRFPWSEDYKQ